MLENLQRDTVTAQEAQTTPFMLAVRWLWVGVPLAWGTLETVRASLAFFR
jgi:hypothetical protein